jgi:isopenicillin N synthase-like dioxygenase
MATGLSIPVIDFTNIIRADGVLDLTSCPEISQVHTAFTDVGFLFIKNHGIDRDIIKNVFDISLKFFNAPLELKNKYSRKSNVSNDGYISLEGENIDPSKPSDLKEAFNVTSTNDCQFPDDEFPEFRGIMKTFLFETHKLAIKILEVMGHALSLQNPGYFIDNHQSLLSGSNISYTTTRILYYPPLSSVADVKLGQLRCGEHVDYGSITLLFQDPHRGLQVKRASGDYIDVPYISDAVLVNLGALMQNWTCDQYLATPHRVINPSDVTELKEFRQSIAVFIHPDNDAVIKCIDGSDKYPPITAYEDTYRRLARTYKY